MFNDRWEHLEPEDTLPWVRIQTSSGPCLTAARYAKHWEQLVAKKHKLRRIVLAVRKKRQSSRLLPVRKPDTLSGSLGVAG
jgi:hypothetical protein